MIERKPLLECYKSSVFKSVDQAWQQIIAFDLQKKMVVIRSLGKKVYCKLACEQALCLGKKIARKGKGRGERACRHTFEAAIPPSCNYLAEHLSARSLSVNQFRA